MPIYNGWYLNRIPPWVRKPPLPGASHGRQFLHRRHVRHRRRRRQLTEQAAASRLNGVVGVDGVAHGGAEAAADLNDTKGRWENQ